MRVYVNDEDANWASGRFIGCQVFLDGDEIKDVVGFDTDRGEIERFKRDETGELVVEGGCIVHELLKGTVTYKTKGEA